MICDDKNQPIKIINLKEAIAYIEKRTGEKVTNHTFENNTITAYLRGSIEEITITATLSFTVDKDSKSGQ